MSTPHILIHTVVFITWSDRDNSIGSIHDGQWVMASLSWTLSVKLYSQTLGTFGKFKCHDEQYQGCLNNSCSFYEKLTPAVTPLTWDLHSTTRRGIICIWMTALYNYWLGGQTSTLWICGNILQLSDTQLQQHISNLHTRESKMLQV